MFSPKEVIQHPDFDDFSFENDVAVIVLEEELDFSISEMAYLPVCKPNPYYNGTTLEQEVLTAAGWGTTQNGMLLISINKLLRDIIPYWIVDP